MPRESEHKYSTPDPRVPSQHSIITSRVTIRPKYALIPGSVLTNITSSALPSWKNLRCWVLTTPGIGYGTTFAEYLMYLEGGGGCNQPETEEGVESFLFVLDGKIELNVSGEVYSIPQGGFAFIPPDLEWEIQNPGEVLAKFLWVRKLYESSGDLQPQMFVGNESEIPEIPIEGFEGRVRTQYLFPRDDIAYDININLINWDPGSVIPLVEMHVNQHGLYMLQGQGVYLLNGEWHEVSAGDYIWMAPFCPQAFICSGSTTARYLLYKDVNRQFSLRGD